MANYLNIIVTLNGMEVERLSFAKDDVTIGRASDCDVVLENAGVSRRHALITQTDEAVTVVDLGSGNGIFVNSISTGGSILKATDKLQVSKFTLSVVATEAPFPGVEVIGPDGVVSPGSKPGGGAAHAGHAGDEQDEPQHTVFLTPEERSKLVQKKAPPPPKKADNSGPRTLYLIVVGIGLGLLINWMFF